MSKHKNDTLSIAYSTGESNHSERDRSAKHLNQLQLRTPNQRNYSKLIDSNTITFCTGPAGTGKSHIAIIKGLDAILNNEIDKMLLFRPPVESGPKQGFLPGDLAEKTDPYMQALLEIIYDYLGAESAKKMFESQKIKVGYLGFIRGMTFTKTWVILDECQNATQEQLKTFLTRLGKASKIVITGDQTQIDLPNKAQSSLQDAIRRLDDVKDIAFAKLEACDNQRHPLVAEILKRYE